jgi:hypothetical protein
LKGEMRGRNSVGRRALLITGFIVAALLVGLSAAPASAQYGPGTGGAVTCDAGSAPPGATVTCTVTGCPPGSTANFTMNGEPIGSAPVGDDGSASTDVTIPSGGGTLGVTCGDVSASFGLGAAEAAATGSLARTGSDSLPLARIAMVLVAVGGLVVLAARRRISTISPGV